MAALFQLSYSPGSACEFIASAARLGGALLRARVLVDVEDQVVGCGVTDFEVKRGKGLQLAQQLDRLIKSHREGRATLGEAFHGDLGGADLADSILKADELREIA